MGHPDTRGDDAGALGAGPEAVCHGIAGEIDDGVEAVFGVNLVEIGDQADGMGQRVGMAQVAGQNGDVVPCPDKRFDEMRPDEPGAAGDEHLLSWRQGSDKTGRIATVKALASAGGQQVAGGEQADTERREGREDAPPAVVGGVKRGRLFSPVPEDRGGQCKNRAVVQRQEGVVDPLGAGQLAGQVFFDEIPERDQHLDGQDPGKDHGPDAVGFGPCEGQEDHCIEDVAHAMQLQLAPLRGTPGKAFGALVMYECVEGAHGDLNGDEGPEDGVVHGSYSFSS